MNFVSVNSYMKRTPFLLIFTVNCYNIKAISMFALSESTYLKKKIHIYLLPFWIVKILF